MDYTGKNIDNNINVRLIQEWLCLQGIAVKIDGAFGPVTEYAVRLFQSRNNLKIDGMAGPLTQKSLTNPLRQAVKPIRPEHNSPGILVEAYARQHLQQRPREIGGQNCGPWVRLYMGGFDGPDRRWCAGFVSFIVAQSYRTLTMNNSIRSVYSCSKMASVAKEVGLFVPGASVRRGHRIPPGSIFLMRSSKGWNHAGFVIDSHQTVIRTIEGNAAPDRAVFGSAVCECVRKLHDIDFIFIE